jgi:hypothetical protein
MRRVLSYRSGPGKSDWGKNFGAARIRLPDGSTTIIHGTNVTRGTHAEEEILGVIREIQKEHGLGTVTVEIFGTHPCMNCEVIQHISTDVDVFFFTSRSRFGRSKLKRLYHP